ncbi:MAG TPA: OsmC family protein [Polyangia bacterium]|nr:OsmC family protein [Polyangia bacterium]
MSYFKPDHPTLLADPVTERDHARGPASAEVTVVEYGDFACPFCRRAYGVVRQMLEKSPDVRFVFRANPRSHLFPAAEPAAEAAEAAAARGRFWEMHDRLFETEAGLGREALIALAGQLGIGGAALEAELDGHVHREAVKAQELSGWHSHVISTPTFFVNGVRFEDAPEQLPEAVARARRAASAVEHVFREVRVESTADRRRQAVSVGPHRLVADLPSEDDGNDAGPSPYDLLGAALGACTAMTVQWMADKHHLPLRHVDVRLTQSRTKDGHHVFRRSIQIEGELDDAQRARLVSAADACPVARTLKGEIEIETRFV